MSNEIFSKNLLTYLKYSTSNLIIQFKGNGIHNDYLKYLIYYLIFKYIYALVCKTESITLNRRKKLVLLIFTNVLEILK